jgi:hypothetical protein
MNDIAEPHGTTIRATRSDSPWKAFENLAADIMQSLGFADAAVTPPGTDSGADVRAALAVAQVKARITATSRPEVQQLHGLAHAEGKLGLFFSLGGYTAGRLSGLGWRASLSSFLNLWEQRGQ